jgi:glucokinase
MMGLACDIGGTNTRVGLVLDGKVLQDSLASYPNDDFADFYQLIDAYLNRVGQARIEAVCIALAAIATAQGAQLTNRNWTIERDKVAAVCGTGYVDFINDFEALGFCLAQVELLATTPLVVGNGALRNGPRLVLGAGTGFNAAAWFPPRFGTAAHVSAAECGHITLPLQGEEEFFLQAALSRGRGRASVERALSGNGLVEIYQWCCQRSGRSPQFQTAAEVSSRAVEGADPDCEQAADMFLRLLGRVTGDLALAFLPAGGIYLSGGVTRALAPLICSRPTFHHAFCAKGRMAEFMESFSISLLLDDRAALSGCAEWLRLSGQ